MFPPPLKKRKKFFPSWFLECGNEEEKCILVLLQVLIYIIIKINIVNEAEAED